MLALKIIGSVFAFFGILGILAGFLFRISHWPGSNVCFIGGGALLVVGGTLAAIGFVKK